MNYSRNKKAIVNEVIIPAVIMLVGILLSRMTYTERTVSQMQTPQRLPLPQKLMLNPVLIAGPDDITMQ